MQRRLPLADSPIGGYMYYSYHLAISFTAGDIRPWFFSNFIQLQCSPARLEEHSPMRAELFFSEGTWHFNPLLCDSAELAPGELQRSPAELIDFIAAAIEQDYYVETFVDEFHVPCLRMGGKTHFCHRLLVFGYDLDVARFDIIGFDTNGVYRQLQCSFDEFTAAFLEAQPTSWETTKLLRVRDLALHNRFDASRMTKLLREYMAGTNETLDADLQREGRDWSDGLYGIRTYDFMHTYIERLLLEQKKACDLRGFHLLWEHKKIMLERLQWLSEAMAGFDPVLAENYRPVVMLAESMRKRAMISRYKPDIGAAQLPLLLQPLRDIAEQEHRLLQPVLACLEGLE